MRTWLLVAAFLASAAPAFAGAVEDFGDPATFPVARSSDSDKVYKVYDGGTFGLYYMRVAPKGRRPMLRYPAETLGLILHKEVFFVKKDGARRAEKAQRGDLHFHEKGQIGGGVTVSSSTTYDVLDIVAPDVVPVEVVETDRSLRQPVQAYAYAAARAQLSAQTGPVRRVTVLQSAHITAELLRLTANASLHVDAGRSVLFPVEGGVTVVSGGKSSPLSTHAVFIAEPGEKFRLLPAGGKPLYLLMITVGG